jgi:hypothetical protein
VHDVLERLYGERPGEDAIPRPGDLERWLARAGELLAEEAERRGLGSAGPRGAVLIARMRALIERLLDREARSETELRPALLEASFGEGEDCDRPPLDLGGFRIHGQIDRVDLTADGRFGVVYDYKTGSRVWAGAKLEGEGKLQLQLYAQALRELWEIEPIGGLYYPLARRDDPRPRGFALEGFEATDALELFRPDRVADEVVRETLEGGVARAREVAAAMRHGEIDRTPNGGRCPDWCRYQPICRIERSIGPEGGDGEAGGADG